MSAIIKIESLTKYYGTSKDPVKALDGINLNIEAGEVISLLGVNGAGKTTLSSILATLYPQTSGNILYNDKPIHKDIEVYRRKLGFCPQKPNLDLALNVEENLIFAGRYMLMSEQDIKKRINQLITDLGLEKYRNFDIEDLSGGNKQRVLIARALMHSPDIVILDEPTVGLDPDIRRQLWTIIKGLRDYGVTIVLTTHYLDEAEFLSDRVCLLHAGKIVLVDTASNLKKQHGKATLEEVFIHLTQENNNAK